MKKPLLSLDAYEIDPIQLGQKASSQLQPENEVRIITPGSAS